MESTNIGTTLADMLSMTTTTIGKAAYPLRKHMPANDGIFANLAT